MPFNLQVVRCNLSLPKIRDEENSGISENCYCCKHSGWNSVGLFLRRIIYILETNSSSTCALSICAQVTSVLFKDSWKSVPKGVFPAQAQAFS
jgi:hypothetical protein